MIEVIRNKFLSKLGIILVAVFLICSIIGFAQYKYTQQSGEGFFVSESDHADALENQNELRQILDDLGLLLGHTKRDGLYPADKSTGGTLEVFDGYYTKLEIDAFNFISDITGESIGDLSDVYNVTPANRHVLAYDSTNTRYENRLLVEADISDLGSYLENVVEDTTPELGGDLDTNEKEIIIGDTLSSDHTVNGITMSVTVGESVVFGEVLYPDGTDGKYKKANASGIDTYPAVFIALEFKTDGQSCKVLANGFLRDDSYDWNFGDILLLGETAGDITATVPSDSGDMVQRLGHAVSANVIYFNPSIDVGEVK
jgi:hypothetical protein